MNKKFKAIAAAALFLAAGTLFAQTGAQAKKAGRKTAISLDIVPLVRANLLEAEKAGVGGALVIERFFAKNYSIGLRIEGLTVPEAETSFIGLDGHIRYYFKDSDISGFFIDMGAGYGLRYTNKNELDAGGLMYSLKIGYKHLIARGFFAEPAIGYTLSKPTSGYGPGGFDLGFSIGYAF